MVILKNRILYKHKNLIPLVILVLVFLNTVYDLLSISYNQGLFVFQYTNILAGIILIISTLVYFKLRKYYKYFLVSTLLLGYTNLVNFLPINLSGSFGINSITISFHPLFFCLFVLIYILNYKKANSYWAALFSSSPSRLVKQQTEENLALTEKFKLKYGSLTNEELLEIINNGKFIKQAVMVAQQILEERNSDNNEHS